MEFTASSNRFLPRADVAPPPLPEHDSVNAQNQEFQEFGGFEDAPVSPVRLQEDDQDFEGFL